MLLIFISCHIIYCIWCYFSLFILCEFLHYKFCKYIQPCWSIFGDSFIVTSFTAPLLWSEVEEEDYIICNFALPLLYHVKIRLRAQMELETRALGEEYSREIWNNLSWEVSVLCSPHCWPGFRSMDSPNAFGAFRCLRISYLKWDSLSFRKVLYENSRSN